MRQSFVSVMTAVETACLKARDIKDANKLVEAQFRDVERRLGKPVRWAIDKDEGRNLDI